MERLLSSFRSCFGHWSFHPLQKIFEVIGPLLDHIIPSLFKMSCPQIEFIIYMKQSEVNIHKIDIDLTLTMKLKVISSIIDLFNQLERTMPLGCNIKCLWKLKLIFILCFTFHLLEQFFKSFHKIIMTIEQWVRIKIRAIMFLFIFCSFFFTLFFSYFSFSNIFFFHFFLLNIFFSHFIFFFPFSLNSFSFISFSFNAFVNAFHLGHWCWKSGFNNLRGGGAELSFKELFD